MPFSNIYRTKASDAAWKNALLQNHPLISWVILSQKGIAKGSNVDALIQVFILFLVQHNFITNSYPIWLPAVTAPLHDLTVKDTKRKGDSTEEVHSGRTCVRIHCWLILNLPFRLESLVIPFCNFCTTVFILKKWFNLHTWKYVEGNDNFYQFFMVCV